MYSMAHIGIRVQDLHRSLRFYVDALGGVKDKEFKMSSGSHLIFVRFKDFSVELICKPGDERIPGRNHLAISVPSMEDALQRLNSCGFAASHVSSMGNHARNCFLNGPDGEIIELCEGTL